MRTAAIALLCLGLCGCSFFQRKGFIRAGNATVAGVQDAGKPATLATSDKRESVAIPAGSTVTVTKIEPMVATSTAGAQPAKQVTEIRFAGPTEWQHFDTSVSANTGTVDTSIAFKKVDAEESRPLLYAAILSAVAAGFFLYRAYPTPAFICGCAAAAFGLAWKAAGLPNWFWGVGVAGLVAAVFLYLGHERGQATATPVPVKTP